MLYPLLLCLILATLTRGVPINENCNGIVIHNVNHEKEVLKSGLDSPYQLAIDYDTNSLFFSYSSNPTFKSAYLNLKTSDFHIITGVNGGFANAVDNKKHAAYLGGSDGLYKYNYNTGTAELRFENYNIWQIFVKNSVVYFTTYPYEKVYKVENDDVTQVTDGELQFYKAMLVAIDKKGNILYANSSGLYSYDKESDMTVCKGDYNVNGFATDINGNIYFSTPNSIYKIKENEEIDKILEVIGNTIYGLAVEGDNSIIYSNKNSIIRLKPTKSMCFNEQYKDDDIVENAL